MKRLDDTGETADEIFYQTKPDAEAFNVDDKDPETKEELSFIRQSLPENNECWNSSTRIKVKIPKCCNSTTEFEYLFKQAVLQPFTEEYFANHDDRVRFYTGLSGFNLLKATFSFISPFVTPSSKSLSFV